MPNTLAPSPCHRLFSSPAGVPELLQPLLARSSDTSAARGAASPSGDDDLRHSHDQTTARPTSGSSAAHGAKEQGWQQSGDLRAKKDSPDLTIHLGVFIVWFVLSLVLSVACAPHMLAMQR